MNIVKYCSHLFEMIGIMSTGAEIPPLLCMDQLILLYIDSGDMLI